MQIEKELGVMEQKVGDFHYQVHKTSIHRRSVPEYKRRNPSATFLFSYPFHEVSFPLSISHPSKAMLLPLMGPQLLETAIPLSTIVWTSDRGTVVLDA